MAAQSLHVATARDWPEATLAESGFAIGTPEAIDTAVRAGKLKGLHGVVVFRRGRLAFERYYEGVDQHWGFPLGDITFGPKTMHDLRSVSKSIVSLLYGIALAKKLVPPPDAPLFAQFPAYGDLTADKSRQRILVRHALTMTMGLQWDETISYADPRNSEREMEAAPDRFRYALNRQVVDEPGAKWVYSGGSTVLIARLIENGAEQDLFAFARATLFDPLGIVSVEWVKGTDGVAAAASGLRMIPRDLARIGQLVADGGRWGRAQLIEKSWLDESFAPRAKAENLDYGFQWWLGKLRTGKSWVAGFGNGGQRLFVVPHLDLGIVITAGNYNDPNVWKLPVAVTNIVFDGLKR